MSFQYGPEDAEAEERWRAGMEWGRQVVNEGFENLEASDVPFFLAVAAAVAVQALYKSEPEREEDVPLVEAAMDLANVLSSTVVGHKEKTH